jgi:replication factor C subunit 1
MRLRAAADREEIRQQYFPLLWDRLIRRLMDEGKDGVDEVIDLMDSYFLTREDWDAMVELGVGPMDESKVSLDTQTKATFTRLYNQRSHPLPFMKATSVVAPKKQPKERPDLEDAIDESDEEEDVADADVKQDDEDEELDLKKDKYVKVPKKSSARAGGGGKGKKAAKAKKENDNEDDFIDDESEKPKKGRGKKGKGKV